MSQDSAQKLKGLLDAGFDLYTFLRSGRYEQLLHGMKGNASDMGGLHNPRFIGMWFKINLQSQLPSLTKEDLSCLSNANLSCESYQILVKALSEHLSEKETDRKGMLYQRFILPFLSRNSTGGCVENSNSSEDWLMKNFQSFAAFATIADFIRLNRNFSGLDALEKLTPEQKADLVLHPEMEGQYNNTIIQVLQSLIRPLLENKHLNQSVDNMTTAGAIGMPNDNPHLKGFLMFLKPLGSFIQRFVATADKRNITSLKVHVLTQVVVNWTLSELAGFFSHNFTLNNQTVTGQVPSALTFNVTNMEDWFKHVVVPILKRFLPGNQTEVLKDLTQIFRHVFATASNVTMNSDMLSLTDVCRPNYNTSSGTCLVSQTAEDLAVVLRCVAKSNMNVTGERIKLLVTYLLGTVTLHMMNATRPNITLPPGQLPAVIFSSEQLQDPDLMGLWAVVRLAPALLMSSEGNSSCLIAQNFSCEAFQAIVHSLSQHVMDRHQQTQIYKTFIKPFLSRSDTRDPGCIRSVNGSRQWLEKNFGKFAALDTLEEFSRLNLNFSAMDVLSLLTPVQLAEFARSPGRLRNPRDSDMILKHVKDKDLGDFFDEISPFLQGLNLTQDVRSALLQNVLDRTNLSDPSVHDTEVLKWLKNRLRPFLPNITRDQVKPLFKFIKDRDCETIKQGVHLLSSIRPTLMDDTKNEIQGNILQTLRGPPPLRCYKNNSFYVFLNDTFLDFGLPNLTTVLSLIPPGRKAEVVSSFHPSELGALLRQPNSVDNNTNLCTVFNNYNRTPDFLESEELPASVRRLVLPCVWPLALAAEDKTEADRWFNVRLRPYLPFLNKELLSSGNTLNASCLSFSKLVGFLGSNHSFNGSDFTQKEAYETLKQYLASDTEPKCYNATDPRLNSTAWFVNYIGGFVIFVTSDDLDTFGSGEKLQVFTVNPQNIQLFTTSGVPGRTITSFTQLIFLQNPNFSVFSLPPVFQCGVPGSVYSKLNQNEALTIIENLNRTCANVDSEVFSALAGNVQNVTADTIGALGQGVVGLNTAQIASAPPSVILGSLSTFSAVQGWSQGQLISIVSILFQQNYQINNTAKLVNLGSLVGGVPSTTFTSIPPAVALNASQNPVFIANLQNAPLIVQQTFIKQIIKVDAAPQTLLVNIPNAMATQIPRNLLLFQNTGDVVTLAKNINKKKWKPQQAVMFFDTAASGLEAEELSEDVLQGFTCSRVRNITKAEVKSIIRACRSRPNRRKVVLEQKQLTCMYNIIKADKPTDFANYSSDMLLYYKYEDIPKASCKSYFTEVGNADFSVLTKALSERRGILLNNARQCLGIAGNNINRENLAVLGNMACTLDRPYIQNSDPEVVEKMKDCNDLTEEQANALQTVLIQGNTKYGPPAKWKGKTLNDLGVLPLYFTHDFWKHFNERTTENFLKPFLKNLRGNKTQKMKLKGLFKQLMTGTRAKRADECTAGSITKATISDDAFPFGYDATQFRLCLSAQTVKDNLAGLTEKVDVDQFQRIILEKLTESYPSGLSDEQVQLLGSVSRVATLDEIGKWNISSPDTLAALMNRDDGAWESDKSKAIVTKFLSGSNSLGSSELNVLGGPNLCALDTSTVKAINSDSIKGADSLDVSNCTTEKKRALFDIAKKAFPLNAQDRNSDTLTTYQLIRSYLRGANTEYIKSLSSSNVNMDIETFVDLDESVVLGLSVSEVRGLLGSNLPDLESYKNESVVQRWISRQFQSELDTLNLNLTGGKADPTTASSNSTTTAAPNTTTTATTTTTTTTITTTSATTSAGNKETSYSLSFIFLMLTVLFMRNAA
ncbi:hypothetical protein ACEWY4_002561 [Coilia grayii]|uniref:Mesothelin-like protein n=1 Tax=Coilia grayii TaxID=363190 RepID=A0ABD1KNR1_9TELE